MCIPQRKLDGDDFVSGLVHSPLYMCISRPWGCWVDGMYTQSQLCCSIPLEVNDQSPLVMSVTVPSSAYMYMYMYMYVYVYVFSGTLV